MVVELHKSGKSSREIVRDLDLPGEMVRRWSREFETTGVRVGKFEFTSGAASSLSIDYLLIRLGDIILIKAIAAFRQGKTSDAFTAITQN